MLSVGLTGGIGSGKSTVASRLAELGCVIIDADAISRAVVEPGEEAFDELVAAFGTEIVGRDGSLDRAALAARAFAGDEPRQRLNAIVHPRVAARTAEMLAAAPEDAVVVHDVPLLVENGLGPRYHLVLVVDAPADERVRRLAGERGMDEADARSRIAAQASTEQRRAAADVWLDNSGDAGEVRAQLDALWAQRLGPFEANVRLRVPSVPRSARTAPDRTWPAQAERLAARIAHAVPDALRVDHIGATAVPGLPARDVLELQLVLGESGESAEPDEPAGSAGSAELAGSVEPAGSAALVEALAEAGFPPLRGATESAAQGERPVVGPAAAGAAAAEGSAEGEALAGSAAAGSLAGEPLCYAPETAPEPERLHASADPARPAILYVRRQASVHVRAALLWRDWLRAELAERSAYAEHAAHSPTSGWLEAASQRAEQWARRTAWQAAEP